MSRVFITGSADGLGKMAAQLLVSQGHRVVLHARNASRAREAMSEVPGAEEAVTGDLASLEETKALADQVNALGAFDAVIHNAAIGYRERERGSTAEGAPRVFAINTLAPYLLTVLIRKPERLIYLGSGMHRSGESTLRDREWKARRWDGSQAYADSKLQDVILAFALARLWPSVYSNAVDPGWVPTKMGGRSAPDDLSKGAETQAWLAVSDDAAARVSGQYFYHKRPRESHPAARDLQVQDTLLAACARLSGVPRPE
ncbi:MAG: SDR family NAD(P)-dependent oxidoreductase [Gemmatimonadota bacterium]